MSELGLTDEQRRTLTTRLSDMTKDPGWNYHSARAAAWAVHWWMTENGYQLAPSEPQTVDEPEGREAHNPQGRGND